MQAWAPKKENENPCTAFIQNRFGAGRAHSFTLSTHQHSPGVLTLSVPGENCPTTASLQERFGAGRAFSSEENDRCVIVMLDEQRSWDDAAEA